MHGVRAAQPQTSDSAPGTPRPETQLLDFDSLDLAEESRQQGHDVRGLEGSADEAVQEPSESKLEGESQTGQAKDGPAKEAGPQVVQPKPLVQETELEHRSDREEDGEVENSKQPAAAEGVVDDVSYWQHFLSKAPKADTTAAPTKKSLPAPVAASVAKKSMGREGEQPRPVAHVGDVNAAKKSDEDSVLEKVKRAAAGTAKLWQERSAEKAQRQAAAIREEILRKKEEAKAKPQIKVQEKKPKPKQEPGPIVEVSITHATKGGCVKLQVPTTTTMLQVKHSLVSLVGHGHVPKMRLAHRQGGIFEDYKDTQKLGEIRELILLGLDISKKANGEAATASTAQPQNKNLFPDVLVVISIEGTRHEGDTAICVPENANVRAVRHTLAKKLRWSRVMRQGHFAVMEDSVHKPLEEDEALRGRWWLWLVGLDEWAESSDEAEEPQKPATWNTPSADALRQMWLKAADAFNENKLGEGDVFQKIASNATWQAAQASALGSGAASVAPIRPLVTQIAKSDAAAGASGSSVRAHSQLVGRWMYGSRPEEWFDVSRSSDGSLCFSLIDSGTGRPMYCRLEMEGKCLQGRLTMQGEQEDKGSIRLRGLENGGLCTCFRPPGWERWMPESISHRAPILSGAAFAPAPLGPGAANDGPQAAETCWREAAQALVDLLLRLRSDIVAGGRGWMECLNRLISYPPRGQLPFTGGDDLTFDDFASALLHDVFVAVRAECLETEEAKQLRTLLGRMEEYVVGATRHLQPAYDWTSWPGALGKASFMSAVKAGAIRDPPFGGFGDGNRYLLFVGLPIALYVSDCPHLYQLVRRLRSLAKLEPPISADMVRTTLDHDGLPYSMLVYSLMAALQALHAVRLPGQGAEGLQILAPRGSSLLFRGMWVPSEIDEHRAEFSWSFNSFSRSMDGVLSVLNFYMCADGSEAAALARDHSHVFVLISRLAARGAEWAFPVQLFAGGEWTFPANVEQEVVYPPFVRYVFEDALELSTVGMDKAVMEARIRELERRWGVRLAEEAPALMRMLEGEIVDLKGFKALGRPVRLTVRFVRVVEPAEPVRELFRAVSASSSNAPAGSPGSALGRLLDFPQVEERMPPQENDWQEALGSLEQLHARPVSEGSPEREPPMWLYIVGTWNNFVPDEMWWWAGLLVYPVVVGSKGWESFQLLVDSNWKAVIYPSIADANVLQKGWKVCGPDNHGHGKNWQIGKRGAEKVVPGARVLVMVSFNGEGGVKGVRWRPA